MLKRLRKVFAGVAMLGLSIATYVATLPLDEQQQYVTDMELAATTYPELAPYIKKVCPECIVKIDCWFLGMETREDFVTITDDEGNKTQVPRQTAKLCRYGIISAAGDGTSPCDPADYPEAKSYPCEGSRRDYGSHARKHLDTESVEQIRERVFEILKTKREQRTPEE